MTSSLIKRPRSSAKLCNIFHQLLTINGSFIVRGGTGAKFPKYRKFFIDPPTLRQNISDTPSSGKNLFVDPPHNICSSLFCRPPPRQIMKIRAPFCHSFFVDPLHIHKSFFRPPSKVQIFSKTPLLMQRNFIDPAIFDPVPPTDNK